MITVNVTVTFKEQVDVPIDFIMYKRDKDNQKIAMVVGRCDEDGICYIGWSTPNESVNSKTKKFDRDMALTVALGRLTEYIEIQDSLNPASNSMTLQDMGVPSSVRGLVSRAIYRLRSIQNHRNPVTVDVKNPAQAV